MRKSKQFWAYFLTPVFLFTILNFPVLTVSATDETGTGAVLETTTENEETTVTSETESMDETTVEDEEESSEEATEEAVEAVEETVEETADEMDTTTENLDSDDAEVVDATVAEIEADLETIEADLDEAEEDGYDVMMHRNIVVKIKTLLLRIKIAQKTHNKGQLTALKSQLRNLIVSFKKAEIKLKIKAKKVEAKIKLRKILVNELKNQVLLSVRWGQIRAAASGATVTAEDWSGSVSVTNGKIVLVNPILFEENDAVTSETETQIDFDSNASGHFDGLLIKVFPAEDGTFANTTLTVNFDDQTGLTYTKADFNTGRYKEEVAEDGRGVVVERRIAGQVAAAVLNQFRENNREEIGDLLEDLEEEYQDDISGLLQGLDGEVQDDFVAKRQKFQHKLDNLMKHLPLIPQEKRQDLLEQKLAVLAEAENLDELIAELNLSDEVKATLEAVLALMEEYNFDALTAVKVQKRIQMFIKKAQQAGLTAEEIEAEVEKLKTEIENFQNEAEGLKFSQGIIPFKDTDDVDWFTQYVAYVKAKNIVGGYKDGNGKELGEFRPANNVTVAEALKMALESAEIGKATSGDSLNAKVAEHWAELYFVQAESLGLTLVADTTVDPSRLATRGEVIRLILEVLGIEPDAVTSTDFSDVPATDANAAYIQYAKEAGVISGDTGATTFRPNDPINRAEVAKILKNMIEILKSAVDVE